MWFSASQASKRASQPASQQSKQLQVRNRISNVFRNIQTCQATLGSKGRGVAAVKWLQSQMRLQMLVAQSDPMRELQIRMAMLHLIGSDGFSERWRDAKCSCPN